jgi:hypothetical protein
MRAIWAIPVVAAVLALAALAGYRLWPRTIEIRPVAATPVWQYTDGRPSLTLPGQVPVAEIAAYRDELFAYLMFGHYRTAPALKTAEVLLTYRQEPGVLLYPVQVRLENNLLTALPLLARAQAGGLFENFRWRYVNQDALSRLRYQTHVFVTAYNLPSRRSLDRLTRAQRAAYIRDYVRYKSTVDPRIRKQIEPVPRALSLDEADQMAADIVAVAEFYSLPLEFFLGIGAIENNYMNVRGDLGHAVWKRRPERGDVVLKRRRGRVLVLNESSGVWQITRETLRYAHRLYLKDTRDYSLLPRHLQPPQELNLDELDPAVLTTYAGLFFRDLLDRFEGDLASAVGAYNGGPAKPNPHYEAGVRTVAEHARRVMEHAATLNGHSAAGMQFWRRRD